LCCWVGVVGFRGGRGWGAILKKKGGGAITGEGNGEKGEQKRGGSKGSMQEPRAKKSQKKKGRRGGGGVASEKKKGGSEGGRKNNPVKFGTRHGCAVKNRGGLAHKTKAGKVTRGAHQQRVGGNIFRSNRRTSRWCLGKLTWERRKGANGRAGNRSRGVKVWGSPW